MRGGTAPRAQGKPWERLRCALRRAGLTWLALELGAGILALCLLVAILPLIVIVLPEYLGRSVPLWAVAADVLSVSAPLAVFLGAAALRLPKGVLR